MMYLIDEVPQEDIHHETEDRAQLNLTADLLTSIEGALSPIIVCESDECIRMMAYLTSMVGTRGMSRSRYI